MWINTGEACKVRSSSEEQPPRRYGTAAILTDTAEAVICPAQKAPNQVSQRGHGTGHEYKRSSPLKSLKSGVVAPAPAGGSAALPAKIPCP